MPYDTNTESLDPADPRTLSPNNTPHIHPTTPLVDNDTYASTYDHNNNIHIKIASLNCNSLYKSSRPEKRRKIITTFKDASFDLVAVQETSTTSPESISILTQQFQSTSSLWTSRVGLISMNHDIHLTQIDLSTNLDDRLLLAQVRHSSDLFTPFHVLNIYAIAQHDQTQTSFYEQLSQIQAIRQVQDNLFILGDFNYDLSKRSNMRPVPDVWLSFLQANFTDCLTPPFTNAIPTFARGSHQSSCIDYIYASSSRLYPEISDAEVLFISDDWTDHNILSLKLCVGTRLTGKGVWRFNPLLLENEVFCSSLTDHLTALFPSLSQHGTIQQQWEHVKGSIKQLARRFGPKHVAWRTRRLRTLQKDRNRILRGAPPVSVLHDLLCPIETEITQLQNEIADIRQLRSGQRWREKGEKFAGYIKRTIEIHQKAHTIDALVHPTTQQLCTSDHDKLQAAHAYYQDLFASEPVDEASIAALTACIQPSQQLTAAHQARLSAPIPIDLITTHADRTSSKPSCPGPDGLTYGMLLFVYRLPLYQLMIEQLYNDALSKGIFPSSWHDSVMVLLHKKGDRSLLSQYRPLSMSNCDAKIFTRIVNSRLAPIAAEVLTSYQTGFIPSRFIGDNGVLLKSAMDIAKLRPNDHSLALMLDFMKAYDRVNSTYLRCVLDRFGFPPHLIDCLIGFFFSTQLHINVNGFLTDPVQPTRGLKQGDPLAPMLFNMALEPLIQQILLDPRLPGIAPPSSSLAIAAPSALHQPLKVLAYADDLLVFLNHPQEYHSMMEHFDTYNRASNGKLNVAKSQVFSLAGNRLPSEWAALFASVGIRDIFDRFSTQTMTYLGFPLYHTLEQQLQVERQLQQTFDRVIQPHSTRSLSMRGRTTVVNSLALSKLWHSLRLFQPSSTFFDTLQQKIREFISAGRKVQLLAWDCMLRPVDEGGLGVIDPRAQHQALHLRWSSHMLSSSFESTTAVSSLQLAVSWLKHAVSASMLPRTTPSSDPSSDYALIHPDLSIHSPVRRMQLENNLPRFSVVHPILRCLSNLPPVWPHPHLLLSPAAVLELPLNDIWYPHPTLCTLNPKSYKSLLVKNCFAYDLTAQRLIPLLTRRTHPLNIHPNLSRRLHTALMASEAFLYPVCFHLITPTLGLFIRPLGQISYSPLAHIATTINIVRITSQTYRQAILLATPRLRHTVSWITKRLWRTFWSVPLSFVCKNLWFRILHNKITSRNVMVHARSDKTTSKFCLLCPGEAYHDAEHMLVRCPKVWRIWKTAFLHLCPTDRTITCLSQRQVVTALYSLRFPRSTLSPTHASYLFGSILESIWRHYWKHTVDEVPFAPLTTVATAIKLYRTYTASAPIGPLLHSPGG